MLALAFLRFEVLNARGNIKAANEEGKGEFVGAYCIGIGSLKSGMLPPSTVCSFDCLSWTDG
jgi:phosphatidylinositol phospholipase C delta